MTVRQGLKRVDWIRELAADWQCAKHSGRLELGRHQISLGFLEYSRPAPGRACSLGGFLRLRCELLVLKSYDSLASVQCSAIERRPSRS